MLSGTDPMSLEQLVQQRHSCRSFLPDPVPRETVIRMLELAQHTASWCNVQPWQVIVTAAAQTDRLRQALYAHAQRNRPEPDLPWPRAYEGVYLQRRRACGFGLYSSVGVGRDDKSGAAHQALENFRFFGAPHLALVTTEESLGTYGVLDIGGWVQSFLLAATRFGVASIAQAAVASHAPFLRDWFDIPARRHIVCGVSFGYADTEHPANAFRTGRAPLSEVARFVGW